MRIVWATDPKQTGHRGTGARGQRGACMDAARKHVVNKATDEIPLELGEDSTLLESDDTLDAIGVPTPAFEGLVAAIERERLFEALFEASRPAHHLGRYVVTGTLGRGAMGTVFKAFDPSLDRRVALKVLHKELDAQHTTRLLREAQALAKLSHPNVVQVYEVGEVEGQTFVAMELVKGKTLREWMRAKPRPGWRECIEVFLQVGAGLAAAHERGLVHRDFKPGNAIIDRKGRARVLDFGLARQVEVEDDDISTMRRARTDEMDPVPLDIPITKPGAILGTPAYMPLEQMYGQDADARSDQFSFCVALYEAVYGERPFRGVTMATQVISMTHGHFRAPPKGIKAPAVLRRILLRGLAHRPGDRWPSMEALLVELRRLLAPRGRPWIALGLAGGLLGGLSVLGMEMSQRAIGSPCEGAHEQLAGIWDEPRRQAVQEAFLRTGLPYAPSTLEWVERQLDAYADAWTSKYVEVCKTSRRTEEHAEQAPGLPMGCLRERQTALHTTVKTLGNADVHVVENAIHVLEHLPDPATCDAVELHTSSTPQPRDPRLLGDVEALRERLAELDAMQEAGEYTRAFEELEPIVLRAKALAYMPLVAEAMLRRGQLHRAQGTYPKAEHDLEVAYTLALEHGHDRAELDAALLLTLVVGRDQSRPDDGLRWGGIALALSKRRHDDEARAASLGRIGAVLYHQGQYDQALLRHRDALSIRQAALGPAHPKVAESLGEIGSVLRRQGHYDEALRRHEQALTILQDALGPEHPQVAHGHNQVGDTLSGQGKYEEALGHHREALNIRRRALGPGHPDLAVILDDIGGVLLEQGELGEALHHHQQALAIRRATLGPQHPALIYSLNEISSVLLAQGHHQEARLHYERALALSERILAPEHPYRAHTLLGLARIALLEEKPEVARAHAARAVAIRTNHPVPVAQRAQARFVLAQSLWADPSECDHARALAERTRDDFARAGAAAEPDLAAVDRWLADHPKG